MLVCILLVALLQCRIVLVKLIVKINVPEEFVGASGGARIFFSEENRVAL